MLIVCIASKWIYKIWFLLGQGHIDISEYEVESTLTSFFFAIGWRQRLIYPPEPNHISGGESGRAEHKLAEIPHNFERLDAILGGGLTLHGVPLTPGQGESRI